MSDIERQILEHEKSLIIDESTIIPDEGLALTEEQIAAEAFLPPAEEPEVVPEEAPKPEEVAEAKKAPPEVEGQLSSLEALLKAWQTQQTVQAEQNKLAEAQAAERAAKEHRAQIAAQRQDPKWRAEMLSRFNLDPAKPESQLLLNAFLQLDESQEQNRELQTRLERLESSLSRGQALNSATSALQQKLSGLDVPDVVRSRLTKTVEDLVANGWDTQDAINTVVEPVALMAPKKTAPKAEAPKAPPLRKLTPEQAAARSAVSLRGTSPSVKTITDPAQILKNARRGMFGRN